MKLSLVIPCYDEESALPETARRLRDLITDLINRKKIDPTSNIWFVDDGSRDGTWSLIERLTASCELFKGVKLAANRGHQLALLAGLCSADGDAVISLDADLQDDIAVIERMVDAHANGYEIVYAVRNSRRHDSWFKRWSAGRYYRLLTFLGVTIIPDHADYRLMGRAALAALAQYQEINVFLRGIVPQLGFRSTCIHYERQRRIAGESKYPLPRMLALAIDGVTSFSPVPLRIISALGAIIFVLTFAIALWVLVVRFETNRAVPGWASITLPIYALGGLQLLSLGIVGEYVAKVYLETKRRPRFVIEKTIGREAEPALAGHRRAIAVKDAQLEVAP